MDPARHSEEVVAVVVGVEVAAVVLIIGKFLIITALHKFCSTYEIFMTVIQFMPILEQLFTSICELCCIHFMRSLYVDLWLLKIKIRVGKEPPNIPFVRD